VLGQDVELLGSVADSAVDIISASSAFCSASVAPSSRRWCSRQWSSRSSTASAIRSATVSIVPGTGLGTEPLAASLPALSPSLISSGSISRPAGVTSFSAAPRMNWLRITPELPRAPISAALATARTISDRGGSTSSRARLSSSSST
jgi:hypothetical protein